MSNSETNKGDAELHKLLLTLNEPLKQNADSIAKDNGPAATNSGPPKTPQDFVALNPSIQEWYSLHKPQLMSELSAKGLVGDRFVGWSHRQSAM